MNSFDYVMVMAIAALILLAIVLTGLDSWYRKWQKKQHQAGLDDSR